MRVFGSAVTGVLTFVLILVVSTAKGISTETFFKHIEIIIIGCLGASVIAYFGQGSKNEGDNGARKEFGHKTNTPISKWGKLNEEELLVICSLIHPDTKWKFNAIVDDHGNLHQDIEAGIPIKSFEFVGDDESIMQFETSAHTSRVVTFFYLGVLEGELFETGQYMVKKAAKDIDDYLNRDSSKNLIRSQEKNKFGNVDEYIRASKSRGNQT